MRKLYRSMAKAEMARMGYSKVNKRLRYNQWRRVLNLRPINLKTGKPIAENFHGPKKQRKGSAPCILMYA
ncbi:hypothetical protein CE91St42_23560 [Oscillospiraceae bacterium]|nr:hypothetical protein CE91St42_23560 [Oscillospiraceae bacterium]